MGLVSLEINQKPDNNPALLPEPASHMAKGINKNGSLGPGC